MSVIEGDFHIFFLEIQQPTSAVRYS